MSKKEFIRPQGSLLLKRLRGPRRFIQVVTGARQVGKTTLVHQIMSKSDLPYHFASADDPRLANIDWIQAQWEMARLMLSEGRKKTVFLVLDEIQKIPHWSQVVKRFWDEDTRRKRCLKLILLGSAPLLIGRGLTESLTGRFEILHLPHWSFSEMKTVFHWTLNQYLFYGAYPGAAALIKQPHRWSRYIWDSMIETTISRDILLMSNINKPALLRQLFALGCSYSGQILSYNKMIGQLQDAGNTTTVAHYLNLLTGVGMLTGLQKYTGSIIRQKNSSPKFQILNTALMTASLGININTAQADRTLWGRIVESAVGAHLVNSAMEDSTYKIFYWRDSNYEVDFVIQQGKKLTVVEVKSHCKSSSLSGVREFSKKFHVNRKLIVGGDGISVENFLSKPITHWIM